jgi:hypothetical protein
MDDNTKLWGMARYNVWSSRERAETVAQHNQMWEEDGWTYTVEPVAYVRNGRTASHAMLRDEHRCWVVAVRDEAGSLLGYL